MKKATVLSRFIVTPDPVAANSLIVLSTKGMKEGDYRLSIIDSAGQELQTAAITINKKIKAHFFQLKHLPAGPYFVQLTSLQSGKSYREIVLVTDAV